MPARRSIGPPWLVLPTYEEAANLEAVVLAALSHLPGDAHVLVVDDGSPDGTGSIADSLALAEPRLEVMHRARKEGLGPAYIAGFRHALAGGAGLLLEMDADFSHDPADLPRLLSAVEEGADLAIGSRYVPGGETQAWSAVRRTISRGGGAYSRLVLGVDVRDLTGGFRCFRRRVFDAIDLATVESRGYAFQVEVAYRAIRAGLRVVEVPIVFRDRTHGASKMTASIAAEALWRIPHLRHTVRSRSTESPSPSLDAANPEELAGPSQPMHPPPSGAGLDLGEG